MKKIILCAISIACWFIASAQNYFRVEELYNNRKIIIDSQTAIIDINSDLNIKLNSKVIQDYLQGKLHINEGTSGRLSVLKKVLTHEVTLLTLLRTKILQNATDEERQETSKEISRLMHDLLTNIINDSELHTDAVKILHEYKSARLAPSFDKVLYPNAESYLVISLSQMNKQMLDDLKRDALKNVRIKLKAYLISKDGQKRKVHIENFDNYADGEFYEVPRWVTTFSEKDITDFKAANDLAETVNGLINSSANDIRNMIVSQLSSVECMQSILIDLQDIKDKRTTIFTTEISSADNYIAQIENKVSELQKNFESLKNLDSGNGENVLELYNSLMDKFITIAGRFETSTDIFAQLPNDLQSNPRVIVLKDNLASCTKKIKEDIKIVKAASSMIKGVLKPFSKTTASVNIESVNTATGETFIHSLNDLPDLGKISLKTNGKRQSGDKLEIAISYKVNDTFATSEDIVFDYKKLTLELVDFYSVASISVVLAHPFNNSADVKFNNKFQFAPAGSLLLKFGSRKCRIWNLINPGIGIVLATPDLDMDGSPDFSFGGTITVLRDVVSLGLSYDTKTDSPFCHIGLSLPFTVFGGAVNTVTSK